MERTVHCVKCEERFPMIRHDTGQTRERWRFACGRTYFAKTADLSNLKCVEDVERGMRMRVCMWV